MVITTFSVRKFERKGESAYEVVHSRISAATCIIDNWYLHREPHFFHALYVDGLSLGILGTYIILTRWLKRRGLSPVSVRKLKMRDPVSGFCVGFRPSDLRKRSQPDFYPEQMNYHRWAGGPRSLETTAEHVVETSTMAPRRQS